MRKNLFHKLVAGLLAVSLAAMAALTAPGLESVAQAANGLSVTGVIGFDLNGESHPDLEPNPQDGWWLVPGTNVRLLFEINDDKKSVSLIDNNFRYGWVYHYDEYKDIPIPTLSLEIPAYVDGYPVTRIGSGEIDTILYVDNALQNLKLITVTIPDTVTTLTDYLFHTPSLTGINLPDSITHIGQSCFSSTGIQSVVIPKNITKIEMSTFAHCKSLINVTLPDGLTEIGTEAFENCQNLVNITIPDSVKVIGVNAFADCKSLSTFVIPDGVTEIKNGTFSNCASLTSITIPASVTKIAGGAFGSGGAAGSVAPPLKTVTYKGTPEQWASIKPGGSSKTALASAVVTCSDGTKFVDGKVEDPSEEDGKTDDGKEDPVARPSVKSVHLSADTYTYNGKARKPSVTATDSNGNQIPRGNYTVTYKDNKNVGQATVTVKFKGSYSGTVKKTFTIKPARASITKAAGKSKSIALKWKKKAKQVSGYQIQYSTSKKFTKGSTKSIFVKKASASTATLRKLKAGKRYYVRIRTYKTAKVDGKSKKLYSSWSSARPAVAKK